ncbi:M20/M25/M40 family metallo-hydrolase [Sphingopyxis sp. LARHCG72]
MEMNLRNILGTTVAAVLLASPAAANPTASDLSAVRDAALKDRTAWDVTESLSTEVGPRPVGSPAMDRARDWGVAMLKKHGFQNIRVETFTTPAWRRIGDDHAEIVGPYPHRMKILALGKSASTPESGLEAPVAVFRTYQELLDQPVGALQGKIAVVTQKMTKTQDLSGYVGIFAQRIRGAYEAKARGAVGYLTRSISTADDSAPHTGGAQASGIPAGALSPADSDLLENMAARGTPVTIRLRMASEMVEAAPAYNISGDLPGSGSEVVVVGGHLDSWDVGTGAVDDAAGIGIMLAAAKLAAQGKGKPRRTLRVVMWGSEEQGGSSAAYAREHQADLARIVVAGESDTGADRIFAISLPKASAGHPAMQAFVSTIAPLKVFLRREAAEDGGADISDIVKAGVPTVSFDQDMSRYMDIHHSENDTIAMVDREQLAQNVAVWATFMRAVAFSDIDFRSLAAEAD